jgi:phenylacetate-CoA ligase
MLKFLRELRDHERWTPDEIAVFQTEQLRSLIGHARATCPFYADYPEFDYESPAGLASYPVLEREAVRRNAGKMLSRSTPERQRIWVGTTGTTGAALRVSYDDEAARTVWAYFLRQWAWAGLGPNEPRITFFGSRTVPPKRQCPPYWTYNLCEKQMLASCFHLSSRTASDYIGFLRRNQGKVLEAFPSVLGILADFVLEQGETIPMKAIFTSGEPLYPFLREKAERAFGARAYDTYGMTELCGLIQECERGRMHLAPEYSYLEILDGNGDPVPRGAEGFLVWTGFVNKTMPFIRYQIGDRGRWDTSGPCECGRHFPLVVPTITRDSDLLRCLDGRIFSPRTLNQTLKSATSFRFCQFVHDGSASLVIRAVANPSERAIADLAEVRTNLQKLLGPGMEVSTVLASEPIMRAGGKIPLILNLPRRSEGRSAR